MENVLRVVSLVLLASIWSVAGHALEVRVEASLDEAGAGWVGEQRRLRIDLHTDGLSFRDLRFRLPDIPGTLLVEDATTTVKWSETIDGATWQVLRHEYPLFPQRSGSLPIGEIVVEGEVTAGFGTEPEPFRVHTPLLTIVVRPPPGMDDAVGLITSSDVSVEVEVDREPGDLRVGDAFTRIITRRARDVSGMAFAPLSMPAVEGVSTYPRPPEVTDRSDRGELVGMRVEATTYVFQIPGRIVVPGVDFEWWDPAAEKLRVERVPAIELEVASRPLTELLAGRVVEMTEWCRAHPIRFVLLLAGGLCLAGLLAWTGRKAKARLVRVLEARREGEVGRFHALRRACRRGRPAEAYAAYVHWRALLDPADRSGERAPFTALTREAEHLQMALVTGEMGWKGGELLRAAVQVRRLRRARRSATAPGGLSPLNPG